MATTHEEAAKVKDEANENFPFLFFTFLLLLPQEIVLEQEHTMADEEHFFLPTSKTEYPWAVYTVFVAPSRPKNETVTDGRTDGPTNQPTNQRTDTRSYRVALSRLKNIGFSVIESQNINVNFECMKL